MRLYFDESAFLEVYAAQDDLGALPAEEKVHHPDRDVAHAFFCRELKHSHVRFLARHRVADHECHRVGNLQSGQLVERGCR